MEYFGNCTFQMETFDISTSYPNYNYYDIYTNYSYNLVTGSGSNQPNFKNGIDNAYSYGESHNLDFACRVCQRSSSADFFIIVPSNYDYMLFSVSMFTGTFYEYYACDIDYSVSLLSYSKSTNYYIQDINSSGLIIPDIGSLEANYPTLNGDYVLLDFTNFEYDTIVTTPNGHNIHSHAMFLSFSDMGQDIANLSIYLGSYNHYYDTAYQDGYADGYDVGHDIGYDSGYDVGYDAGVASVPTNNAIDIIGSAFNAVGNVLSIEVLPHVTLGLAFSIPMVLVIIMTIFKIVKK